MLATTYPIDVGLQPSATATTVDNTGVGASVAAIST